MVQIKAPQFPESIADGEVATWHVSVGEAAQRDQILVDIETDKVVLEVVAPEAGTLTAIYKQEGETVLAEELLGEFELGEVSQEVGSVKPTSVSAVRDETTANVDGVPAKDSATEVVASPAARKIAEENKIDMTAPVSQISNEKISMTAPVMQISQKSNIF